MTAFLAFLKNWKVIAGAAMVALVVGVYFYTTHLQHLAKAQKQQLAQAARQIQVQTETTKAVDQVATKTVQIEEHTHDVIRTIHDAPGADSPVPADVLSAWRNGLRDTPADPPA